MPCIAIRGVDTPEKDIRIERHHHQLSNRSTCRRQKSCRITMTIVGIRILVIGQVKWIVRDLFFAVASLISQPFLATALGELLHD